jgi:hypothetical protein
MTVRPAAGIHLPRLLRRDATPEWRGAYVPYDLVKELAVALAVVAALTVALTVVFSSPDDRPSTIRQWARTMPGDFLSTATAELAGTSGTATYGPPYNHTPGAGQAIGPIKLQRWLGVSHPIDTARDYVLAPLASIPADPPLRRALAAYAAAPASRQAAWTDAYAKALDKAKPGPGGVPQLPAGSYGPVPVMMSSLLGLAQTGGLDGALLTSRSFYQTDYTKPLLFMADGGLLSGRAQGQHLLGSQWGMMNETGSYPGQVWLWLYTFWYQIQPFSSSSNADAQIWAIMAVLSLALICVPFIPGVRDIPRWVPVHRLIWREHYRRARNTAT